MTTLRRLRDLAKATADRLNPLLVKELRQALKGRLFLLSFGLLLLGAWLISILGVTTTGEAIYWQSSPWLLGSYVVVLQVAVLVFVPAMAFRSMQVESEANTWELICITTMTPSQLIRGKLGSALVQTLLLFSVIAPCVAFCSLLPGFDWVLTAIVLAVTLVLSLLNTIFSVMLSSVASTRYWQNFGMIVLLAALIGEAWFLTQFAYAIVVGSGTANLPYWMHAWLIDIGWGGPGTLTTAQLLSVGLVLLLTAAAYFTLFYEIAVSQVTFEADSRSGRIRVICSVLYVLQWVLLLLTDHHWYHNGPLLDLFVIHWGLFGLFACLEPETISTRIRRKLSGWSRLRAPYLPGGSRALAFLLLHLGLTPIVSLILSASVKNFYVGQRLALWSMYLVIYSTLAVAGCRSLLAFNPHIRLAALRVGVLIAVVVSMLPSVIVTTLLGRLSYEFFLLLILNPFDYLALDGQSWTLVTPLILLALIGVHLNWHILKRSVLDVEPIEVALTATPAPFADIGHAASQDN